MTNNDLNQIAQILDQKLKPIQQELQQHGKVLKSLKKDQDTMLNMLDKEQMQQRKRIARLEENTGIQTPQ